MRRLFVLVPTVLCLSCTLAHNKFVRPREILDETPKPQRILQARQDARAIAGGDCRYVKYHPQTQAQTGDATGFEVECNGTRTVLWVGSAHYQRVRTDRYFTTNPTQARSFSFCYTILMQKYIAVVNPRMDDDEISHLIAKNIAGALFEISHQNYPLAAKIIRQVKEQGKIHNRPISIIQDTTDMQDPLDLEFGLRNGADWVASGNEEHLKMVKGLDKRAGIIFKGRNLPKGLRVDSLMSDDFSDPDAQISSMPNGQIRHLILEHPNQVLLDSLLHIAEHAGASAIAVSDLDTAKALSFRRPGQTIIFATKDRSQASKAAIYWGVHPVFMGNDLVSSLKDRQLVKRGQRLADATDIKHVEIHSIP